MNYEDFFLGGLASLGATIFTNPIEVVKTRMQLQGELAARGTYIKPYKGVFEAFITVAKNEGMTGLQKGLVPALYFQFTINAFRLSIYNTALQNGWMNNSKGDISLGLGYIWGALAGSVGSYFSSPFFLVKTRLQSKAKEEIAVGYQHKHNGMMEALRSIYQKNGIRGLWKNSLASIPRSAIGSGAQIGTFGKAKAFLNDNEIATQPVLNSFCAGLMAGSFMALAITPPDVIATRLYNQGLDEQGRGLYYKGWFDCCFKILRTEGLYGFYKGFWPNYLRIAPHSTLVLLFFDELLRFKEQYFHLHSEIQHIHD